MKKLSYFILFLLTMGFIFLSLKEEQSPEEIALALINSLDASLKERAQMPLADTSRMNWHYLPWSSWQRPGISLKEMNAAQKEQVHQLLQAYLSDRGYEKVKEIISLEEVLAVLENNPKKRDPEQYYLSIYGEPAAKGVWGLNFQGHHISLNFTMVGGEMSYTPRFFGANPGEVKTGPKKGFRALKAEEDLGLQLVNALNENQKAKAIFKLESFWDIVSTNQATVSPESSELAEIYNKGISVKEMNNAQQQILFSLLDEYLVAMPEKLAKKRMDALKNEEIEAIRFGWAGATELGKGHYYFIIGKTFLVEFDNTQNNANHIHTVWRDFDGDWGRDLLKEHYHSSDHHD